MSHQGVQLQDGHSAGLQCHLARTGGPQVLQSVQSVPASQLVVEHLPDLLYRHESSGIRPMWVLPSSMQPVAVVVAVVVVVVVVWRKGVVVAAVVLLLLLLLLSVSSHRCWIGQLHSP